MKRIVLFSVAAVLGALGSILHAQVPQIINYQGRVVVGPANFDGIGNFKFALVSAPLQGTTITYWSNDGTSNNGSEPTDRVAVSVSNGLYSVLLGDASLANMTAVPASVFNNSDVRLRVWFNDGVHGSQLLTPDQRIAAVGYAVIAANVPDGAITSAKIATGAVGNAQLAAGAVATNLYGTGQSGVVILSATENPALVAAGYIRLGTTTTGDTWQRRTSGVSPAARYGQTAVWTGSEMIVWGGNGGTSGLFNDGGRYNPVANTWSGTQTIGAPAARYDHTAVWADSEMIVWGGAAGVTIFFNDGARYDPAADSWSATPSSGAPSARAKHTAVWTGSEMIVWGGYSTSSDGSTSTYFNDGKRYNPAFTFWSATASGGAPAGRYGHTAVWTGSEMIVWGGYNGGWFNDGARYNPVANTWSGVPSSGAPTARTNHTAIWTGSEMIVWGGGTFGSSFSDGKRYNPDFTSWAGATTSRGAPAGRVNHTAVWTGSEMIVWGGYNNGPLNDGGRYNPLANSWSDTPSSGTPSARSSHTAVWTGSQMIIYGGTNSSGPVNDTLYSYTPGKTLILYQKP